MYIAAIIGICAVVLLVLFLRHLEKNGMRAQALHDLKLKEYEDSLLKVAILATVKAPRNERAHELVIEAACKQVQPFGSSGPLRLPELGDHIRRYEQGISLCKTAADFINFPPNSVSGLKAPIVDVARKNLYDAILTTYMEVSVKCPARHEAHVLILKACRHLVFPHGGIGGPMRHPTRADFVEYYNRGLDIVGEVKDLYTDGPAA